MKKNIILWSLVPILSALYQLFTKLVAHDMENLAFGAQWLTRAASTPWMWAALICEMLNFALWLKILSDHDLSKVFPLTAISYVLVLYVGWFGFHETILPLQLAGSALILIGVWFIGTAHSQQEVTL